MVEVNENVFCLYVTFKCSMMIPFETTLLVSRPNRICRIGEVRKSATDVDTYNTKLYVLVRRTCGGVS